MDQDTTLNAELQKILQCQQPPSMATQQMKDSGDDMNLTKYDADDDQNAKTQIRLWLDSKLKCQEREVEKESQNSKRKDNMEEKLKLNSKALIIVTQNEQTNIITDLKINLASNLTFISLSKQVEIGISQKMIRNLIISTNKNSPEISNEIPLKQEKQVKPLPSTSDQINSNENTQTKEVKSDPKDISYLEISKFSSSKQESPQSMVKNENLQAEKKCSQVSQNWYDSPPKTKDERVNDLDKTFIECSPFQKNIKSKFSTPVHQKYIEKPPGEVIISPEAILVKQFSSKGCKKQKKRQKSPNEPLKIVYNDDTSFDIRTKSKQSKFLSEQKISSPRQKKLPIKAFEQENIFKQKAQNLKEGMHKGKNISQKKIKKNKQQIIDQQLAEIIQNEIRIQSLENDSQLRQMQEKIKNNEWYQYLQCLSLAQTQITYLAQQMGYIAKFVDGNSQILPAMYSCTAEIGIMSNGVYKKYIGVCQAEKSKKEARHHASILCLAQLYSRNNFVWNCFKQIKIEKAALRQPLKSNNSSILERWWRKTDPEEINSVKIENDKQGVDTPDVDKYIKSLKSCKHDLYYFIAQNNKIFMTPRWLMRKPNIMGYWEAEGFVRYQIHDKFYEYRYKNKGRNKKQCEQLVSQSLLRQIYRDFPLKFKKYRQIKNVKGLV